MPWPTADQVTTRLVDFLETHNTDPHVATSAAEAVALVSGRWGTMPDLPEVMGMRVLLEVAADLYYRRASRNGVVSLGDSEVVAVRISRDPLSAAEPMMRPWVGWGIG